MKKPAKLSKYSGDLDNMDEYATAVDKDFTNLFEYILRTPKIYQQATEPTLDTNEMAYWKNTGSSKFYLILNIAGDQKKVELN